MKLFLLLVSAQVFISSKSYALTECVAEIPKDCEILLTKMNIMAKSSKFRLSVDCKDANTGEYYILSKVISQRSITGKVEGYKVETLPEFVEFKQSTYYLRELSLRCR